MLCIWWSIAVAASPTVSITPLSVTPLAALAQPGVQLQLDILTGVSPQVTVQQIASTPDAAFAAFNPDKISGPNQHSVLWLRFRVLADETSGTAGWTVSLAKPFVDRVSFFYRDAQGAWQAQSAGDRVAHRLWPVRALYPQFNLPPMAPGVHTFYLRVQNSIPLHFSIDLQPSDQASAAAMDQLLQSGFVLSLMVFMAVLSLTLACVQKNKTYGWYAAFASANFFAVAGYVGMSAYLFWPDASWWPEYSALVPAMLATMAQLHFSRLMFENEQPGTRLHQLVNMTLVFNLLCVVAALVTPDPIARRFEYGWVMASSVALTLFIVLRAWGQGVALARLWMFAYTPLVIGLTLTIVKHFGIWPINGLPFMVPVYAIAFELPVLLFILLSHSKAHQAHAVREATLASADPLKGYTQRSAFDETAQKLWNQARAEKKDVGIAYVKVVRDKEQAALVNSYDPDRERAQWVRIMRTVMREGDTVAQIDDDMFALFFKGQSVGEDFSGRLSRLVALGLMAAQDYSTHGPVQFRIVAGTRGSSAGAAGGSGSGDWATLDRTMRARLIAEKGWSRRSIRMLSAVPVVPQVPDENHSDAWAQALAAQIADERKQH